VKYWPSSALLKEYIINNVPHTQSALAPESGTANAKEEMGKLRAQLLDMGKNNNLVNYQSSEDRSVRITEVKAKDVFRSLVIDGNGPRIISSKATKFAEDDFKGSLSQCDIDARLERLHRKYREDYEALGYTTVFAAMGFLTWSVNGNRAPMILLPLRPERDASGNVRLYWNGDDVRVSPTFIEKLKDLNIRIDEPDAIEDMVALDNVFETISNAIDGRVGFKVTDAVTIDTFDFSKSVMFNDLNPDTWSEMPELVDRLLDPTSYPREATEERTIPSCTYSILDGDSSQMSVVMDVLDGKSVVVEGPPGTGKSQTISNIISECVGNGKTVLFVSEKMAALNVVKRRLNEAGLESYVLELHSDNMNRKNFLREMERSMNRDMIPETYSDQDCVRLERIRTDLDAYVNAISEPLGDRGFTPYQLIGMRDVALGNIKRRKRVAVRFDIENAMGIDDKSWDLCINLLRTASEVMPFVSPIKKNPWRNCKANNLTPDREYAFRDHMYNVMKRLDETVATSKDICKILGIQAPQTMGEFAQLEQDCSNIIGSHVICLKDVMENDVDLYAKKADSFITMIENIQQKRSELLKRFRKEILEVDVLKDYDEYYKSKKSVLKKTYKEVRKTFDRLSLTAIISDDSMDRDFEIAVNYQKLIATFDMKDGPALFGDKWNGIDSDVEGLRSVREWTVTVKRNIASGRFSDNTALLISRGFSNPALETKNEDFSASMKSMFASMASIMELLGMEPRDQFKDGYEDVKPAAIRKWVKDLDSNMDTLRPWGNYCDLMEKFAESPIKDMAAKISSGDIHPLDMRDTFIAGYTGALLAEALENRQPLRNFSQDLKNMWIKDFCELDVELLKTNCNRLRKKLLSISQERMETEDEGIRVLKGEFNRGTGQMAVRKIMNKAGKAIQAIKPCFMMSPRSVAQYLGNREMRFDVVIFDEASQVLPADSIGTLLRGNQAVIMGDSKQLPPTIFFEKKDEGTSETATARDMESLLNLCRASLPVRVLSWHYRSKHSSLMALTNRLFYDDRLMVCPSPAPAPENMGLKLRYVRTAVYQRGATGTNPKEAMMIARAVWHHYVEFPDKSLGIATFNINQQKAITDAVEKMFRRHPDARANMMKHVTEPFIIRNLESIQGDERDVMFVSIGYGYDSDGKLSKNFGALNRAGGERRLNVLMTRAREQCVMFSNFRAMDMGMRENVPEGVSALQAYLEYAELGHTSKLDSPPIKDDLVESIGAFLASKGVRTAINVGNSGLRIDVAVCSPKDPSVYVMGICLDSPTYQRMNYTRDRERTFPAMLKRMGWNIYPIWSMEWYSNSDIAKKKLWAKVSSALTKVSSEKTVSDPELFDLVSNIVEECSPIPKDAVLMKVRSARGIQTVPAKMKRDIDDAIETAMSLGRFTEYDGFLMIQGRLILPRDRPAAEKWKPEWIHPEEYIRALKDSEAADLSAEKIIESALKKLGLPVQKVYKEWAQQYLGAD